MENFVDILIPILIFILFIIVFYLAVTYKTKSEIEYNEKIKKRLAEEYITDPETGIKLTLEQAESGHWIAHTNEFRTIPESELENLPTEDEKIAERALNYLRESKNYLRTELSPDQLQELVECKILSSYDDWHYSSPYEFTNGFVFLPAPEIHGMTYYEGDYCESHLMFAINIKNINGHYLFREKSIPEKFLDLWRKDDDIELDDYECFTFKKSENIILIRNILKNFKDQGGLMFEIDDNRLFIKTSKLVNLEDIIRIENIIKNIS